MRQSAVLLALLMTCLLAPAGAAQTPAGSETTASADRIRALEAEMARLAAEIRAAARAGRTGPRFPSVTRARSAVEPEIKRLETELQRLAEEVRQASAAADGLSQAEQRRINLTVYGDLQVADYRGENAVFDGRTFELVLSASPHRRLSFFGELEFEQAAGVGGPRGGEIVVEQAHASLKLWPMLNFRAGVLLVPFGNVNTDHFAPKREVVNKPLVSYVVAPSDWTDNGLGFYGSQLMGSAWLASYEAYAVAGLGSQVNGAGMRDARQPYGADNNGDKALVGRVAISRGSGLVVGLSGYRGAYDDAGQQTLAGWAVDSQARLGRLKLTGEYNEFRADRAAEPQARLRGYYLRAVLDVGRSLLRRTFLGRDFDEPRLLLVGQYDQVVLDAPVGGAVGAQPRTTADRRPEPAAGGALGPEAHLRVEPGDEPTTGQGQRRRLPRSRRLRLLT